MFVGTFIRLRSELQLTEIFLSRHSLLQNLSTFSEEYVRTSGTAAKDKYLQQELYFSQRNFTSTWFEKPEIEIKMVSVSFLR